MEKLFVKDLKKGTYFKLVKKDGSLSNKVYVRDDYCRSEKKFCIYDFNDICNSRLIKPNTVVSVDFIF